jgi:hypothetical protein
MFYNVALEGEVKLQGMGIMCDIYLAVAWNPSRYIMVTEGREWGEGQVSYPTPPIEQRFALNRDCIGEVRDCFPAMGNSADAGHVYIGGM